MTALLSDQLAEVAATIEACRAAGLPDAILEALSTAGAAWSRGEDLHAAQSPEDQAVAAPWLAELQTRVTSLRRLTEATLAVPSPENRAVAVRAALIDAPQCDALAWSISQAPRLRALTSTP